MSDYFIHKPEYFVHEPVDEPKDVLSGGCIVEDGLYPLVFHLLVTDIFFLRERADGLDETIGFDLGLAISPRTGAVVAQAVRMVDDERGKFHGVLP